MIAHRTSSAQDYQPRAAALAAKRKAVCFAAVMLLLLFIYFCRCLYLRTRWTDLHPSGVIRLGFAAIFVFY